VLYKKLAASAWAWEATSLYIGDERWVPRDHKDSNYRMIFESFYPHPIRLERWKTELAKPDEAAADYAKRIKGHLLNNRFDLILLGIGTDGHTASLFPGTAALGIEDKICAANWVEQHDTHRLTFTYPLLKLARNVWFVASGDSKKPWIEKMAAGTDKSFPAARVECEASEPVIYFNES
jgi:6-phosphogluconolactonase